MSISYQRAERRIEQWTLAISVVACVVGLRTKGWKFSVGIALGALVSWLNFRWLKSGISTLAFLMSDSDTKRKTAPASVYIKFLGRFILLLAVVYVILTRPILPGDAVLLGLFTVIAAVLCEMVYQLFLKDS